MRSWFPAAIAVVSVVVLAVAAAKTASHARRSPVPTPGPTAQPLPTTLRETGLYADWTTKTVAATNRPFTPQYPLWSDGASKRRWIYLPPGTSIDGSRIDAWQFPIGTRFWKEFSFRQRVETRYMERTGDGWRYATYVWNGDESDATLAPSRGVPQSAPITHAVRHAIPSVGDCRVCHGHGATPVLGFSALQLSSDRDPGAVHREPIAPGSIDASTLLASRQLHGFPRATPPRIEARTAVERAALGYLHGNCGGCHRQDGAIGSVGLVLASSLDASADAQPAKLTTINRASHFTNAGHALRIAPGDPGRSLLLARMSSRAPAIQMPPLATRVVDEQAVQLIARWIDQLAESNR